MSRILTPLLVRYKFKCKLVAGDRKWTCPGSIELAMFLLHYTNCLIFSEIAEVKILTLQTVTNIPIFWNFYFNSLHTFHFIKSRRFNKGLITWGEADLLRDKLLRQYGSSNIVLNTKISTANAWKKCTADFNDAKIINIMRMRWSWVQTKLDEMYLYEVRPI